MSCPRAALSASYSARGGSRRDRGWCGLRVHEARAGQASQSAFRNMMRTWRRPVLRSAPSRQPEDKAPRGQRACLRSQSNSNRSAVKAPSTLVCQAGSGRPGPTRAMPCSSRLRTGSSAPTWAEPTRCSPGARPLAAMAARIAAVHLASCTVAVVVITWVMRLTASSSQVSLRCTTYPTQLTPPRWRKRASVS